MTTRTIGLVWSSILISFPGSAGSDLAGETLFSNVSNPAEEVRSIGQVEDATPRHGAIRVYWENDGAVHDPFDSYDRHYTNGFAITAESQPEWADNLAPYMPFADLFNKHHSEPKTGAGVIISQLIFTPANLGETAPITIDQPYAGYLYGGLFWDRQGKYNGRDDIAVLDHFEFNIGIVGDFAFGEDVQTWFHDSVIGEDPRGWDNQLANEVTAQFFYRRKWRIDLATVDIPFLGQLDTQAIPQAGFAFGTVYRYAEAATTFRIGYQLPDDFGPGRINDLQSASGDMFLHDGWYWYAYARVGGRFVEHNLFLDGSNYTNASQSVPKEPFVGEVQAGIAISYRPNIDHQFELSWGVTFLTDTFDALGDRGAESYGTVVLSWVKSF